MTKIEALEKDKKLLEDCVNGINAEIEALQCSKSPDYSLITKKIRDLEGARKLLDKKTEELDLEKVRDQNQPNDAEQKKIQALFDKKSNSYSAVRTSYVKPIDN
jgi:hypothetical protein